MVDDDVVLLQTVCSVLRDAEAAVTTATDFTSAIAQLQSGQFDLVLADIRMRRADAGMRLLDSVRADWPGVAVVLMTAYSSVNSARRAFLNGACDYLTKPFTQDELLGSVHSAWRMVQRDRLSREQVAEQDRGLGGPVQPSGTGELPPPRILQVADIKLDLEAFVVYRGTATVRLTPAEARFLATLLRQPDRAFSYAELADAIGVSAEEPGIRTLLQTHVHRLRGKLKLSPPHPPYIVTVRGVGYRFRSQRPPGSKKSGAP